MKNKPSNLLVAKILILVDTLGEHCVHVGRSCLYIFFFCHLGLSKKKQKQRGTKKRDTTTKTKKGLLNRKKGQARDREKEEGKTAE